MYKCEILNITDRTQVFVVRSERGIVAQFPHTKPRAAESFAAMLEAKGIETMEDWLKEPWSVQRDFIFATSCERPNLPWSGETNAST